MHYLLTSDGAEELQGDSSRPYVIVARSACLFFSIDVSSVPAIAREGYIRRQLEVASPFKKFGQYLAISADNVAMVWLWDADWESARRSELPVGVRHQAFVPETVMTEPCQGGARLLSCSSGFEFQVWRGPVLRTSRWFRTRPDETELLLCRRAYCTADADLSEHNEAPLWLGAPWTEAPFSLKSLVRDERALFSLAGITLVCVLVFELGWLASAAVLDRIAVSRSADLSAALAKPLQYRAQAQRQREIDEEWLALLDSIPQLEIIAEISERLAGIDFQLVEWDYNRGALRLLVRNPEIDRRAAIEALSSSSMLQRVSIEPGLREGESELTMVVERAPKGGEAQ